MERNRVAPAIEVELSSVILGYVEAVPWTRCGAEAGGQLGVAVAGGLFDY